MTDERKVLIAGITDDCIQRLRTGEIETIHLDAHTDLEIHHIPGKVPDEQRGRTGDGTYLFSDRGVLPPKHKSQITSHNE